MEELCWRLIRDGKIVGEVLYCTLSYTKKINLNIHLYAKPKNKGLIMFWRKVDGVWWGCLPMQPPQADFFDMGVNVGERWFENDLIETIPYGKGIIEFNGSDFLVNYSIPYKHRLLCVLPNPKRIGNIYEEE